MVNQQGDEIGKPSSVIAGSERDETALTTESIPQMVNFEWGKAASIEDSIRMLEADGTFRPDELLKWRSPVKDAIQTLPNMKDDEDQFVVLYLAHILHGMRVDASEFLVSVLAHYGIEWYHLTPNSITVLSIFTHLCEAYMAMAPTLEVFVHFYRLYPNMQGGTMTTRGGAYLQLRDSMKMNYPMYYLKTTPQAMWTSQWFYAKLPQSCRLTFRGDALKEANSWKDLLALSHDQEEQVTQITELSNRGLTGVDIIRDYLKHRISPLRRRMHLACKYTGPADPTRDSYKDFSVEEIESKLSYLLDLKKMGMLPPPSRPNVPTSLIEAPADERANRLLVLSPKERKRTAKRKPLDSPSSSKRKANNSSLDSGAVSNVLLDQPVRDSPPKEVDPAQSVFEREKGQEATVEPAPTPVHSTEETNNDMQREQMQEVLGEVMPLSEEAAYTKFLEQAKKLVLENKRLKDEQTTLVQQVEDLQENRRFLEEKMQKAEQEALKRIKDIAFLNDNTKDLKQMIDELNKNNKSIQEALIQKCTEMDFLKEKTTELIKDREVMQSRVSHANEFLKLTASALSHCDSEKY